MGKPPEKTTEAPPKINSKKTVSIQPMKKLNCFVMPDKPEKPGLMLVSTNKIQDGCYVLGWQPQAATWLVSEGTQFYQFAGHLLKADLAFTSVFAFCLLVVLVVNRVR